jgi:uroporphyrinogen decarboxylase
MNGRQRMLKAISFEEPDRPPHFEMVFDLPRQAFGLTPHYRWHEVPTDPVQKEIQISDWLKIYERLIGDFGWDAIQVFAPPQDPDGVRRVRKALGDQVMVGAIVWKAIWSIDIIPDWERFSEDLIENPGSIVDQAEKLCLAAEQLIDRLTEAGAEFIMMASDVGFNGGPFISPGHFRQVVTPYLHRLCQHVTRRGAIPMMHTDGMIMSILDQIMEAGPKVLQSIDPMAGMDIAAVKKLTYGKMALMGNVQCSYLEQGPEEAIRRSALCCLDQASPGGGYIYSSSNTIFDGVPLRNYLVMLEIYREWCARHGCPLSPIKAHS